MAARDAKTAATGRKPGGKTPAPPLEGPGATDQVTLTDVAGISVSQADAAELAGARVRGAELVVYPTGGHMWVGRNQDLFTRLRRFLA